MLRTLHLTASVLPLRASLHLLSNNLCLLCERHQICIRQFNRATGLLHLGVEQLCIHNLQQRLRPQNIHLARNLRQFPQLLRNQHPALSVHLCHLSVKVRYVQKLLPYRIHGRHLRQRSLNLLPFLQRVNLRPLPIHARDVKLGPVKLIHPALELSRQLQPTLLVHACWVISPKHTYLDTPSDSTLVQKPLSRRRIWSSKARSTPKNSKIFYFAPPASPSASAL